MKETMLDYLMHLLPEPSLARSAGLLLLGLVLIAFGPESAMQRYAMNIIIAIDQVGTTLVCGYPDETLSSYAYRMDQKGRIWGRIFRPLIDFLFAWKSYPNGHCADAYQRALQRVGSPPELR